MRNPIAAACAAAFFVVACGTSGTSSKTSRDDIGDAPLPHERPAPTQSALALTPIQSQVLAELHTAGQRILFTSRSGLGGEELDEVVEVQTFTKQTAADEVSPLLGDGATPLEVYNRFAPEHAVPPQALVDHHRALTRREGRETSIREYSKLAPVDAVWADGRSMCTSASAFRSEIDLFTTNVLAADGVYDVSLSKTATSSSNLDVYLWSCNYPSAMNCGRDRKRVVVYVSNSSGGGAVADVQVDDCEVYVYHFASRTNGSTYGITARDGNVLGSTDTNVRTYHAVGWQRSGADIHSGLGCATCGNDDNDDSTTDEPDKDVIMDFAAP